MEEVRRQPHHISLVHRIVRQYKKDSKWDNALLGDIKSLSNTHVGDVGQDFIEHWCKHLNLNWVGADSKQSPWDAKIEDIEFEIKTATEDINGNFQFNHIRYHRPYRGLICLGIAPDDVLFDCWTKGEVSEGRAGHLVTMDKGSSATWKLTKKRMELYSILKFNERINSVITKLNP